MMATSCLRRVSREDAVHVDKGPNTLRPLMARAVENGWLENERSNWFAGPHEFSFEMIELFACFSPARSMREGSTPPTLLKLRYSNARLRWTV
jgi:hypothetical protein